MKNSYLLIVLFLIASCASKKDIVYFQDSEILNQAEINQKFEPIIEANDILHITISSMNENVLAPFLKNKQLQQTNTNTNPGLDGYLVSKEGEITFSVIGKVKVSGLTRGEAEVKLKNILKEYVTDVVVDIRIMNFEITVMGEVKSPGLYTINDERVSLPEALAMAGDLTSDGKRQDITVIREIDGVRKVSNIDITSTEFFSSEFFFLKQNDIVYVEPSTKGVKKSGFIPDVPALLSLFTVVLSSVILITNIN